MRLVVCLHILTILPFSLSITCYSQLCQEGEDTCGPLSTCHMEWGYCYNRVYHDHPIHHHISSSGVEAGCSTEFTSLMAGRCAGDPSDIDYTCACSTDLCNEYFINRNLAKLPSDHFSLRRIQCAEDDHLKCEQYQDRSAPCKIPSRTYCVLIKHGPLNAISSVRRESRTGYWPFLEYVYLSEREIICIQGLTEINTMECYCKYDNCNTMRQPISQHLITIDYYYYFTKCYQENRFYSMDDLLQSISSNQFPLATCIGHRCFVSYERNLNSSTPWIRIQRGCMNISRPGAFFDHVMDSIYGPQQRGTRICKEQLCNNISVSQLAQSQFLFSSATNIELNVIIFGVLFVFYLMIA